MLSKFYAVGMPIWIVVFMVLSSFKPFASTRELDILIKAEQAISQGAKLTDEQVDLIAKLSALLPEAKEKWVLNTSMNAGASLILTTTVITNGVLYAMYGRGAFNPTVAMVISGGFHAGILYVLATNPFQSMMDGAEVPIDVNPECKRCEDLFESKLVGESFRQWSLKNHTDKGGDREVFQEVSACKTVLENCPGEVPFFSAVCRAAAGGNKFL